MSHIDEMLNEARQRVRLLSDNLPSRVDPASISLIAKIPYKALDYRECLIWRVEELSRAACDCFERRDAVAGVILTRSVTESSAAVWYLHELIKCQIENEVQPDLDEKIMRLLLGHKNSSEMPEAINVLTFCKRVDKTVPGFWKAYESMSEIAHPNWSGTVLAYSKNDTENYLTDFGKDIRDNGHAEIGLNCLLGALMVFEYSYNKITDMMPDFIRVCEAALSLGREESTRD